MEGPAGSDHPTPPLPSQIPRFRASHSLNEMGAYMANASYMASLGGPPSADIKWGIIMVPAGEEQLLFSGQPGNGVADSFFKAIAEARPWKQPKPMHEPDRDSKEFLRPRFTARWAMTTPRRPRISGATRALA